MVARLPRELVHPRAHAYGEVTRRKRVRPVTRAVVAGSPKRCGDGQRANHGEWTTGPGATAGATPAATPAASAARQWSGSPASASRAQPRSAVRLGPLWWGQGHGSIDPFRHQSQRSGMDSVPTAGAVPGFGLGTGRPVGRRRRLSMLGCSYNPKPQRGSPRGHHASRSHRPPADRTSRDPRDWVEPHGRWQARSSR